MYQGEGLAAETIGPWVVGVMVGAACFAGALSFVLMRWIRGRRG